MGCCYPRRRRRCTRSISCSSGGNSGVYFVSPRFVSRLSVRSSSIVFISSKMNSRNGLSHLGDTEAEAVGRGRYRAATGGCVCAALVACRWIGRRRWHTQSVEVKLPFPPSPFFSSSLSILSSFSVYPLRAFFFFCDRYCSFLALFLCCQLFFDFFNFSLER